MKIKVSEWLAMRPVERYMEIQRAYVAAGGVPNTCKSSARSSSIILRGDC